MKKEKETYMVLRKKKEKNNTIYRKIDSVMTQYRKNGRN